jgi:hypothetical protein
MRLMHWNFYVFGEVMNPNDANVLVVPMEEVMFVPCIPCTIMDSSLLVKGY